MNVSTILSFMNHDPAHIQDAEAEEEMARWKHWDFEDGFERGINLTSNELERYSVLGYGQKPGDGKHKNLATFNPSLPPEF